MRGGNLKKNKAGEGWGDLAVRGGTSKKHGWRRVGEGFVGFSVYIFFVAPFEAMWQ